jgi:hypothetical protein
VTRKPVATPDGWTVVEVEAPRDEDDPVTLEDLPAVVIGEQEQQESAD